MGLGEFSQLPFGGFGGYTAIVVRDRLQETESKMAAQAEKLIRTAKEKLMNKKLMVAAVAAAFVAPAALAQSSVTIGGTVDIIWDTAKANGATNNGGAAGAAAAPTSNNNLKSADRVRDGAGSNIRFTVIEDLGGGNSAFVQVESAVIVNSDQRTNALGAGGAVANQAGSPVWGNRNSGIGLRSKTMGRILIGVWDVHYHETYNVDPGWIPGNAAQSILGLMNSFGAASSAGAVTIGGRYSNVIRWDSPTWGGFDIAVAYARPTDAAPANTSGSLIDGKNNRAWNFAPKYQNGGLTVVYSYLSDKDIAQAAAVTLWGFDATPAASLWKITSNRLGARYKFANGLGIGAMWDSSKTHIAAESAVAAGVFTGLPSSDIKRTVWAFPVTYDTGNHHIMGTYARAGNWRGNLGGTDIGSILVAPANVAPATFSVGSETGARMWSLGYQYNLSQRTNISLSYASIRNKALARYDFFANSSGLAATGYGADPRTYGIGLRHTW
jgi:predicted porin